MEYAYEYRARVVRRWHRRADWDACKTTIDLADSILTVCPFVALVPGPDERTVFAVDVPDGRGNIRSIAVGFANTIDEAKAMITEIIERIESDLKVV